MKRLFLSMMAMAAIATTLTLTSCGSDDEGNDTPDGASILATDGKTLMGNLTGKQTLEEGVVECIRTKSGNRPSIPYRSAQQRSGSKADCQGYD